MKRSPALLIYSLLASAGRPFVPLFLWARIARGKEDVARVDERRGMAAHARPEGRSVWMHGASIGECLSLLPCMEEFVARGFHIVVTSGSVGSARVLGERLPAGALHQFLPLDVYQYALRFLDHWQPEIVLFAESEIWPNIFRATRKRRLPLVVVNARLSPTSFERWRRARKAAADVFGSIDLCLVQTKEDGERFAALGTKRVRLVGNMKFDATPPPADPAELSDLSGRIGARPVWAAVSTHHGEEEIGADAHLTLRSQFPALLTIIAPRHPRRADAVAQMLVGKGLRFARRSHGATVDNDTEIYLADTLGETGLIYRLCKLAFIGRSLTAKGGQNPIEAAKLNCAILHGPHVGNFREVYAALEAGEGAFIVEDQERLSNAVAWLLSDAQALRRAARNATHIAEEHSGATARVMQAIAPYLASHS
ncbi:MAG: 3-deoxy-D-manno-octulosonic-acid transferase [Methylobacteriaceae bacterium]|jgi:3-deoxy-D-manno-octulosonic-acid transferase|nr:3-deoxy-D-manno-octulosonic-acid transferase [Methylobacteriaceae bacterium]